MKRRFPTSVLLSILFLALVIGAARARGRQGAPATAPAPPAASPFEGLSVPAPAVPAAPQVPPPLPQGSAADLDLVFTNQVIGWIEPCG
ncbi:MAG TPA: hypothetical protein VJ144_02160 [Candidatus Polarisedimenticolia bacterium]|nr:hypothetical protein [Candidatus Polarisedimenticolia bacterium]